MVYQILTGIRHLKSSWFFISEMGGAYTIAFVSSEGDSCEFGSQKYLVLCGLGGILSCGTTHTAVVPLDLVKCRMQVCLWHAAYFIKFILLAHCPFFWPFLFINLHGRKCIIPAVKVFFLCVLIPMILIHLSNYSTAA